MFTDIGKKIKSLAQIVCWIGIIGSAIGALATIRFSFLTALLILAAGALGSWLGSFALYAFGELVDNSALQVRRTEELIRIIQRQGSSNAGAAPAHPGAPYVPAASHTGHTGTWTCKHCHGVNASTELFCKECGKDR